MRTRLYAVGNTTVDRVMKSGELIGYWPGGATNVVRAWSVFVSPKNISLVSKVGDDLYAKTVIDGELERLSINSSHITRVPHAESRLYEIDVTDSQKPRIDRKQDANEVMKARPRDLDLNIARLIFFQSFATVFETQYVEETIKTIEEACWRKVPVYFDMNIRQKSVERITSMNEDVRRVLKSVETLKVNEGEASMLINPDPEKEIEKITLSEEELPTVAEKICEGYDVPRLAITMGERGSYLRSENEEIRVDALRMPGFVNSLGCGDCFSAGDSLGRYGLSNRLTNIESLSLASVLGGLVTLVPSAYPVNLTRESFRETVRRNKSFFDKNDIDAERFLDKIDAGRF